MHTYFTELIFVNSPRVDFHIVGAEKANVTDFLA